MGRGGEWEDRGKGDGGGVEGEDIRWGMYMGRGEEWDERGRGWRGS